MIWGRLYPIVPIFSSNLISSATEFRISARTAAVSWSLVFSSAVCIGFFVQLSIPIQPLTNNPGVLSTIRRHFLQPFSNSLWHKRLRLLLVSSSSNSSVCGGVFIVGCFLSRCVNLWARIVPQLLPNGGSVFEVLSCLVALFALCFCLWSEVGVFS